MIDKAEYMKKYRQENKDRIKEQWRKKYSTEEYKAKRRERYKNNTERVMKNRLNGAASLLYRYDLINDAKLEEIKKGIQNGRY